MSSAGVILAINLSVAALFTAAFAIVAVSNTSDRVARWFALAYGFGIAYLLFEFALPSQADPRLVYDCGFAAFLGAVAAVTVGIARRYGREVPWGLLLGACAAFVLLNHLAYELGRPSLLRMLAYQAPYALLQAVGAAIILRSGRRQAMDVALAALFALSAVHFLAKPLLAVLTGGPGAVPQAYIDTDYALYSQSFGAVLQVGSGLLMLMLLVRDMLVEITMRSETDALSGLYNRRGFDARAEAAIQGSRKGGMPAALVAADLDNFKRINDSFGHDAGDRVIEAFASVLRAVGPERAVLSRWGGEEFVALLPGTNLAGARLFAESVRGAFATLPVEGMPDGTRLTASFGVAQHRPDEQLSDLRRRADAALYDAKQAGRNRVCVSGQSAGDGMPEHPLATATPAGSAPRPGRRDRAG